MENKFEKLSLKEKIKFAKDPTLCVSDIQELIATTFNTDSAELEKEDITLLKILAKNPNLSLVQLLYFKKHAMSELITNPVLDLFDLEDPSWFEFFLLGGDSLLHPFKISTYQIISENFNFCYPRILVAPRLFHLVSSRNIPEKDLIEMFYKTSDENTKKIILQNNAIGPDFLKKIATEWDCYSRIESIMINSNANEEVQKILIKLCTDYNQLRTIARNSRLECILFELLQNDKTANDVWLNIINNERCSPRIFKILLEKFPRQKQTILSSRYFPEDMFSPFIEKFEAQSQECQKVIVFKSRNPAFLKKVYEMKDCKCRLELAHNAHTPIDILKLLKKDPDINVRDGLFFNDKLDQILETTEGSVLQLDLSIFGIDGE